MSTMPFMSVGRLHGMAWHDQVLSPMPLHGLLRSGRKVQPEAFFAGHPLGAEFIVGRKAGWMGTFSHLASWVLFLKVMRRRVNNEMRMILLVKENIGFSIDRWGRLIRPAPSYLERVHTLATGI